MRYYGGLRQQGLNETIQLHNVIGLMADEYQQTILDVESGAPQEYPAADADGARARFETFYGLPNAIRDFGIDICDRLIRIFEEGVNSQGNRSWPRGNHWPNMTGQAASTNWEARTCHIFIYGVNYVSPYFGGPGYFHPYSLWTDGGTLPNVTTADKNAWHSFYFSDRPSVIGNQRYKLLRMARNTLNSSINYGISWLLPVKAIPEWQKQDVINTIRQAAAGNKQFYSTMRQVIVEFYLPDPSPLNSDGSRNPIPWRVSGDNKGFSQQSNLDLEADLTRRWAAEILGYAVNEFGSFDDIIANDKTWEDLKDARYNNRLDADKFSGWQATAGVLERLKIQQTTVEPTILNQEIQPGTVNWRKSPDEPEEEEP